MKILLLEDVKKLGKKGEIIDVSDGYAKNYILPKKLGKEATKQVMNEWTQKKGSEANRKEQERLDAIATMQKLEKLTVVMKGKAGDGGRLFGSITSKDIAEALKAQHGIELDRRRINMKDPIRAVGNHSIEVKLHQEAVGHLAVSVLPLE